MARSPQIRVKDRNMSTLPKFGYVGEKAKTILVFPISELHHSGEKVIVKPNLSWDQIVSKLKTEVKTAVPVTKVVDINAKQVHGYDELVDGGRYVLCGPGPVTPAQFPPAIFSGGAGRQGSGAYHEPSRLPAAAPAPGTSQSSGTPREITKFGTQKDRSIAIYVFRNGDQHDKGTRVPIINYRTFDQLTTKVSSECKCIMPCRRLAHAVRMSNGDVKSLEDLKDGEKYIALGGEAPNKEKMSSYI